MPETAAMPAEGEVSAEHTAQQVEGGSLDFGDNRRKRQFFADVQPFCFISVREQAIMPDFHESLRQDMHKEPPDKLKSGNSHNLPLVVVPVVAPLKCDLPILKIQDAVVGNGNAVSIAAEVFDNGGSGAKRRFAVDDPFFLIAGINQVQEIDAVIQIILLAIEVERLRFQKIQEFPPELAREHLDRNEELFPGTDPCAVPGHASCGDYAVDVWVERQILTPCVQD